MQISENTVATLRDYYVVKSNELLQNGRYNLTTQQQKIVLFAISKIKKGDDPQKYYTFHISELCAACGIGSESNGGTYYQRIREDLEKLFTPIGWIPNEDTEWLVAWFQDAGMEKNTGNIYIQFHKRILPYLFNLTERYTQYHLEEVLVFKNKYAIRIYETLRSYFSQEELDQGVKKSIRISIKHIREMLNVDRYPEWKEFNRRVIKAAIDEINEYARQMKVSYTTRKKGRSIDLIIFTVELPSDEERAEREKRMKERLKIDSE